MPRQGYPHGRKAVKTEDPLLPQFLLRTSLKRVDCKRRCGLKMLQFAKPGVLATLQEAIITWDRLVKSQFKMCCDNYYKWIENVLHRIQAMKQLIWKIVVFRSAKKSFSRFATKIDKKLPGNGIAESFY